MRSAERGSRNRHLPERRSIPEQPAGLCDRLTGVASLPVQMGEDAAPFACFVMALAQAIVIGLMFYCASTMGCVPASLARRPGDFAVLTGEDALYFTMLANGADGGILAASHLLTDRFLAVRDAFARNDVEAARRAWAPLASFAALFGALALQAGANLANDLSDFRRGADTEERLGPVRVTQRGLLTERQVAGGVIVCFALATVFGLYLTYVGGWPIIAIGLASMMLPFLTFYAITSYTLHHYLTVFLVTVAVYGFTTAAMMVPALSEFDIAMGRTKTPGDERD